MTMTRTRHDCVDWHSREIPVELYVRVMCSCNCKCELVCVCVWCVAEPAKLTKWLTRLTAWQANRGLACLLLHSGSKRSKRFIPKKKIERGEYQIWDSSTCFHFSYHCACHPRHCLWHCFRKVASATWTPARPYRDASRLLTQPTQAVEKQQ